MGRAGILYEDTFGKSLRYDTIDQTINVNVNISGQGEGDFFFISIYDLSKGNFTNPQTVYSEGQLTGNQASVTPGAGHLGISVNPFNNGNINANIWFEIDDSDGNVIVPKTQLGTLAPRDIHVIKTYTKDMPMTPLNLVFKVGRY